MCSHIGTREDIKVQIIGYCDPNDQEAKEDFWIFHLDTLHPKGLTLKRLGGAGEGGGGDGQSFSMVFREMYLLKRV